MGGHYDTVNDGVFVTPTHISYSLDSRKGGHIGKYYRAYKGGARSLDYSSKEIRIL